jgi:hypothetical protein
VDGVGRVVRDCKDPEGHVRWCVGFECERACDRARFASRHDNDPFREPVVDLELVSKRDGRLTDRDRRRREDAVGERRSLQRGDDLTRESVIDTNTGLVGEATAGWLPVTRLRLNIDRRTSGPNIIAVSNTAIVGATISRSWVI